MIKLNITGDLRTIANSAWISTTDEIKTKSKTDEDVERVVCFLAQNLHTSPFESVTLTFSSDGNFENKDIYELGKMKYSKYTSMYGGVVTVDLLNFAKYCYSKSFKTELWSILEKKDNRLCEILKMFDFSKKEDPPEDCTHLFKEDISVELVDYHRSDYKGHSRATWRIKCPLSVAVQILRHRTASFNMVSGRYKTIRQELFHTPIDIMLLLEQANLNGENDLSGLIDSMCLNMENSKSIYLHTMKELKRCKSNKLISNDEYKRMREYVRFILPEGRLTELYVSMYLDDLNNFFMLRNSSHAQMEHIAVAQLMKKTLKKVINNFDND